jgi:formate dehydrogenase major subunit
VTRARKSQQMVLELLLADLPATGEQVAVDARAPPRPHGELSDWATGWASRAPGAHRIASASQPAPDLSHPAMAVNLDACIQCNPLRARLPRDADATT